MRIRAGIVTVCLLLTSAYLAYAARAEPTPIRQSLSQMPYVIADWRGQPNAEFGKDVLAVLRVDDYTTRSYVSPSGSEVALYVGYHASQRQGSSIHSPLNCLPGAGWTPASQHRLDLTVPWGGAGARRAIGINRVVIEKGLERQVVLYWYQSQGRVVASEYWGKFYSVLDSVRRNRSDAAMVRVMTPVVGTSAAALDQADARVVDFVTKMFPLLASYLPE